MMPKPRSGDGAKPRMPLRVDVGTARVIDGFGRFVDRVPEPDFAEELSAVNATVTGFSTAPGTVARATVRATVGPNTPLAVSGEMTPPTGPRRYDLLVTVDGYPAPRANPYLQTLFGWRARQGTITLAAHYVVDGDNLEATNDVGMSGLAVERASSTSAPPKWPIGLPLDTFVSLLKNREGDAQLSVPIHGTLSSPKFEIGDAIATALRGIAVKTVTLPFSLVGQVFADEKERIESLHVNPVLFEPGTATPAVGMAEHLDKLAAFLRDKPAVRLLVRPVMSVEDVSRLKRIALRERVRVAAGERTPTAMQEALTTLYAEKFPRRAPTAVDEMIAALAEYDPAPTAATHALAERRVQAVREALGTRGVAVSRLPVIDAAPAVEAEGAGRAEFEITQ
jgi:outer membrane protein OmpA-like peptidoglycan-associated protein